MSEHLRMTARMMVTIAITLSASPVAAQCMYTVSTWPQWQCAAGPLYWYTGLGLNDLGAWCGWRLKCLNEGSGDMPVYCPPGGMPQVLPMPEGATSYGAQATAVNNAGVVVGFKWVGASNQFQQGVIWWPDGSVETIPPVPGFNNSRANDINNHGVIVGSSGGLPYVLKDGVMTSIPVPDPNGGSALRVSDSGYVIGEFGSPSQNTARGFRWKDGELLVLEPLPGSLASLARDVTEAGVVVGASSTYVGGPAGYVNLPTIWIEGQPFPLPLPLGYGAGGCLGVNDAGIAVGFVQPRGTNQGGVVRVAWIAGNPYLLNDLLVPGSPSVGEVRRINNAGQMLSIGGPRLLTPTWWSPMDLNGDCAIDGSDLGVLLSSWGAPDFDPRCDFNGDGVVDGRDLGILLGEWTWQP